MQFSVHYSDDGTLVPVSVVLISCSVIFLAVGRHQSGTGYCRHISKPTRR